MKIGVVVDSTCDLPRSFIDEHDLEILPNRVYVGHREFLDTREPRETMEFFRRHIPDKTVSAHTEACPRDEILEMFLEELVQRYDRVLVLCMSATRGRVFQNATEASYGILQGYRERRAEAGLSENFALRVVDTRSLCAGEALLACVAINLLGNGQMPFEKLRRTVKDCARHAHCYLVPNDLFYLRHRAQEKGEHSLSAVNHAVCRWLNLKPVVEMHRGETQMVAKVRGFDQAVAAVMDRARQAISRGLAQPIVTMSFGGDPRIIRDMRAYQEFEAYAAGHRIELHLAVMSATAGINVGPGAFSLAYLEEHH